MSSIIKLEEIKKNKEIEKDIPKSEEGYLKSISLTLARFLQEEFPNISSPTEIKAILSTSEEITTLTTIIKHYAPEDKEISFNEWLLEQKNANIIINNIEHTRGNITPYALGVFINDLGRDGIIRGSILRIIVGISNICLDVNTRSIVSPIFYKGEDGPVYGIKYALESDYKDVVTLVVTITRTFN